MEEYKKLKLTNFFIRSLSSLLLAPLILYIIYLGGVFFKAIVLIIVILMAFEWNEITNINKDDKKAIIIWKIIGLLYIIFPCLSLIWLREQNKGVQILYWMLANVWATDIFAYIFGTLIGGWKILPSVSPNKTWSGLIGGLIAASVVGYITADLVNSKKPIILISISIVLSVYGQLGDMFESWVKRKFKVKDSGKIIPGHGGILDRVDSIVPVAPKVVFVVLFDKWGIF